jgi:hypothetical protein
VIRHVFGQYLRAREGECELGTLAIGKRGQERILATGWGVVADRSRNPLSTRSMRRATGADGSVSTQYPAEHPTLCNRSLCATESSALFLPIGLVPTRASFAEFVTA